VQRETAALRNCDPAYTGSGCKADIGAGVSAAGQVEHVARTRRASLPRSRATIVAAARAMKKKPCGIYAAARSSRLSAGL
jgi:hypothetical protein